MSPIWLFLCIGLVNSLETKQEDDKLMLTQIIFRHGDRTIRTTYPNDPYKDKIHWPEGMGQLTNSGKRREYELGKYLDSASLVLAGLFSPNGSQVWNENLLWQPIPVHATRETNHIIGVETICVRYDKAFYDYVKTSVETRLLFDKYHELFTYLDEHAGPVKSMQDLKDLYDILQVERDSNKILPEWTHKVFIPNGDMEKLAKYYFKIVAATPELKRLRSGFILREILDRFNNKTLSILSPDLSIYLYSGHDVTISGMLVSLGIFEAHQPPYGSSLHFELYKSSENYYIQLFYRNSTAEDLEPLDIPNCGTKCTINQFYDLYDAILYPQHFTIDMLISHCLEK